MKKIPILLLFAILSITGCTVTESLTVNENKSGSSFSDIQVEQFFIDVLNDFGEFLPSSENSIMDDAMSGFAGQLSNTSSATSVSFIKTGEHSYLLDFDYSSAENLISELGAQNQSLLSISDNSMRFFVDINNFTELTKIIPFLSDPNFEVYGPLYNQGTTEEDYLDMIYYLLGEEGPDAISNGLVTIIIEVPGSITSVSNATKISDNTACFEFPIIDFLLLNEPLTFTINWE